MSEQDPEESNPGSGQKSEVVSLAEMRSRQAELLREKRACDDSISDSFKRSIYEFIEFGREVGLSLEGDSDRNAAQSILDYWALTLTHAGEDLPETELAPFDPMTESVEFDDSLTPYKGAAAFAIREANRFAGRDKVIRDWIDRLAKDRFLAVVGPSGSGKTSLVKAGILSALKNGEIIEGSEEWDYLILSPGSFPLRNLAMALLREGSPSAAEIKELIRNLKRDHSLARQLKQRGARRTVLVVDDFQEIVTRCRDRRYAEAFVQNLEGMIEEGDDDWLLINVQSDHRNAIARNPAFHRLFEKAEVTIPPPSAEDLRAMITQPADRIGLKFEEQLVDQLVHDVRGDPAALLLLQFVLQRLWKSREGQWITWKAYQDIGGINSAFDRAAEEFYKGLDLSEKAALKEILLRLVRPVGENDISRSIIHRDMIYANEDVDDGTVDALLSQLSDLGLVREFKDTLGADLVEVTHEGLATKWHRLVNWLEQDREQRHELERLATAALHWRENDRDAGALWRGTLLEDARRLEGLGPLELEFIDASIKAERFRTKLKNFAMVATIVGALVAAAAFGVLNSRKSLRLSQVFLTRGEANLSEGDSASAVIWLSLARENRVNLLQSRITEEVQDARVANAFRRMPLQPEFIRLADPDGQQNARDTLSQDGRWIASAVAAEQANRGGETETGTHLRDLTTGRKHTLLPGFDCSFVAFSRDSGHLAVIYEEKSDSESNDQKRRLIATFSLAKGKEAEKLGSGLPVGWSANKSPVRPIDFLDKKRILVSATRSTKDDPEFGLFVWDPSRPDRWTTILKSGKAARIGDPTPDKMVAIQDAVFSEDGRYVLAGYSLEESGDQVGLWDLNPNPKATSAGANDKQEFIRPASEIQMANTVAQVEFPRRPKRPAYFGVALGPPGSTSGEIQVRTIAPGPNRRDIQGALQAPPLRHNGGIRDFSFSPDGRQIATASSDRTAKLWEIGSGRTHVLHHGGEVYAAEFSPDGRSLVTGSRDRAARVWDTVSGRPISPILGHSETVGRAGFSSDGRSVVTGTKFIARNWSFESRLDRPPVIQFKSGVNDTPLDVIQTSLSPNGKWAAAACRAPFQENGKFLVWENDSTSSQALVREFSENGSFQQVAFSGNERRLATACSLRSPPEGPTSKPAGPIPQVFVWDLEKETLLEGRSQPIVPDGSISLLALNHDGSRVAIVTGPGPSDSDVSRIEIWDPATAERVKEFSFPGIVASLAFSGTNSTGGRQLMVVGGAGTEVIPRGVAFLYSLDVGNADSGGIVLIDPALEQDRGSKVAHRQPILSVAVDPGGKFLASSSEADNAKIWELKSGRAPKLKHTLEHTADVGTVAFSRKGDRLLTGSYDGTAVLWKVTTGERALRPFLHGGTVKDVSFSSHDRRILTAGTNGKAILWDARSGEWITTLSHDEDLEEAQFSADGKRVTTLRYLDVSPPAGPTVSNQPILDSAFHASQRQVESQVWTVGTGGQIDHEKIRNEAEFVSARRFEGSIRRSLLPDLERIAPRDLLNRDRDANHREEKEDPFEFHEYFANRAEARQRWFAASVHLSELIKMQDRREAGSAFAADLRFRRGKSYSLLGGDFWRDALKDLRFAAESNVPGAHLRLGQHLRQGGDWWWAESREKKNLTQATKLEQRARDSWAEAVSQLEKVGKIPDSPRQEAAARFEQKSSRELGESYSRLAKYDSPNIPAHWNSAIDAYGASLTAENPSRWQRNAIAILMRDGHEKPVNYAKFCQQMLGEKFRNRREVGGVLAWACVLHPDTFEGPGSPEEPGWGEVVRLAEGAVSLNPSSYYRQNTLGAAYYRSGEPDKAIHSLNRSIDAFKAHQASLLAQQGNLIPSALANIEDGRAIDWAILTLAYLEKSERENESKPTDSHYKEATEWYDKLNSGRDKLIQGTRWFWNKVEVDFLAEEVDSRKAEIARQVNDREFLSSIETSGQTE